MCVLAACGLLQLSTRAAQSSACPVAASDSRLAWPCSLDLHIVSPAERALGLCGVRPAAAQTAFATQRLGRELDCGEACSACAACGGDGVHATELEHRLDGINEMVDTLANTFRMRGEMSHSLAEGAVEGAVATAPPKDASTVYTVFYRKAQGMPAALALAASAFAFASTAPALAATSLAATVSSAFAATFAAATFAVAVLAVLTAARAAVRAATVRVAAARVATAVQRWHVGSRALHLSLQLLLLCELATVTRGTRCSSSPTCPAHASDANKQCFLKGYSHFWGFDASPFMKFDFPGKGLYTFVKTQKDVSDCCYDVEVQGFMCHVLKDGSPVRTATLYARSPGKCQ